MIWVALSLNVLSLMGVGGADRAAVVEGLKRARRQVAQGEVHREYELSPLAPVEVRHVDEEGTELKGWHVAQVVGVVNREHVHWRDGRVRCESTVISRADGGPLEEIADRRSSWIISGNSWRRRTVANYTLPGRSPGSPAREIEEATITVHNRGPSTAAYLRAAHEAGRTPDWFRLDASINASRLEDGRWRVGGRLSATRRCEFICDPTRDYTIDTLEIYEHGELRERSELFDYRKVDDIWYPFAAHKLLWRKGTPFHEVSYRVQSVRFENQSPESDFEFPVDARTRVIDARVGHVQPPAANE